MKMSLDSHLKYCPSVWMFQSKRLNNETNSVHEKSAKGCLF